MERILSLICSNEEFGAVLKFKVLQKVAGTDIHKIISTFFPKFVKEVLLSMDKNEEGLSILTTCFVSSENFYIFRCHLYFLKNGNKVI